MIIGMSTAAFTLFHVALSLAGIFAGLVVSYDLLHARIRVGWTTLFLATTVATSATGFMFHSASFGPPQIIGVISLVVLGTALAALYVNHLTGAWRWIYVIGALTAQYLNVFVGVVQAFQKIPFLTALAPTQSEGPFIVAQSLVLIAFVALGVVAVKRFRPSLAGSSLVSART
jgi:hypothetical protein